MSEPTTAEMIAWCEERAGQSADAALHVYLREDAEACFQRAAMLRAIAARLREPPATPKTTSDPDRIHIIELCRPWVIAAGDDR